MANRSVNALDAIDEVYDANGVAYTPADVFANVAASQTDQELVAAVAAKEVWVLSLAIQAGGTATTIVFNSASTALSMTFQNAANGGVILPYNPKGWFKTTVAEALTCTTGAGSTTGVQLKTVTI